MTDEQPALREFGYESITQNGRLAGGTRPLIIVLVEYDVDDSGRFGTFADAHPVEYYERLAFGRPTPPFSTQDPVNPASLSAFFAENSGNRFTISRAALVGPVRRGPFYDTDPGPETRLRDILEAAEALAPDVFFGADRDADNQVEFEELLVVTVENFLHGFPANRDNVPFSISRPLPGGGTQTKTVQVHVAGCALRTPFYQCAHELSHSLGTVDMYNNGAGNFGLTLMSGYSFEADDQVPVHLDAWHKMALGWCTPRVRRLDLSGSELLPQIRTGVAADPVLLWHPDRRQNEYFLVERRTPRAADARYDAGVAGDGVLIWRVVAGTPAPPTHLGAPNLSAGGSQVWAEGVTTPALMWSDGSSTGVRLSVRRTGADLRVEWSSGSAPVTAADNFSILTYGGNGTTPVDSGLPRVGEIYGIKPTGPLLWYRYNGSGGQQTSHDWDRNSSNTVGIGWNQMLFLVPRGDGVLLAVEPNGELRYYEYNGHGQSDPHATGIGWAANSGNIIGIGWNGFRFLCAKPYEGRTTTHPDNSAIYAVGQDGSLRWYRYTGAGEADPNATGLNWHPNSGNIIGQGWSAGHRAMAAISDIILLISEQGDLRWYRYHGNGESDPGATGLNWDGNSGNIIGRGWDRFRHVFGGSDGRGGYVIFAVDEGQDLHWYRYTGSGASDPDGTSPAWDPRSGTKIGNGW
jgi:M6 family metalloprotease-like protein